MGCTKYLSWSKALCLFKLVEMVEIVEDSDALWVD